MSLITLANTFAHIPNATKRGADKSMMDGWCELVTQNIRAEIEQDPTLKGKVKVNTSWSENNDPYLDFRIGLHYNEMDDDHDLVMDLAFVAEDDAKDPWYVNIYADNTDGPLNDYSDMNIKPGDFDTADSAPCPLKQILGKFLDYYKKRREELEPQLGETVQQNLSDAAKEIAQVGETIKAIKEKYGVAIYIDRAVDGYTEAKILPKDTVLYCPTTDGEQPGKKYDEDKLNSADLHLDFFDSSYDYFCQPSK
jgi:hypothetical protein